MRLGGRPEGWGRQAGGLPASWRSSGISAAAGQLSWQRCCGCGVSRGGLCCCCWLSSQSTSRVSRRCRALRGWSEARKASCHSPGCGQCTAQCGPDAGRGRLLPAHRRAPTLVVVLLDSYDGWWLGAQTIIFMWVSLSQRGSPRALVWPVALLHVCRTCLDLRCSSIALPLSFDGGGIYLRQSLDAIRLGIQLGTLGFTFSTSSRGPCTLTSSRRLGNSHISTPSGLALSNTIDSGSLLHVASGSAAMSTKLGNGNANLNFMLGQFSIPHDKHEVLRRPQSSPATAGRHRSQ